MAANPPDDADDEITRIVRRPGPAKLPGNLIRPPNVAPVPAAVKGPAVVPEATVLVPAAKIGIAANDAAPPVAAPSSADRPRPVMTPPAPRSPLPAAASVPASVPPASTPPVQPVAAGIDLGAPPAPTPAAAAPVATPSSAKVEAGASGAVPPLERVDRSVVEGADSVEPVVGWLVVVKGPGRGRAREIVTGRNPIGSAASEAIRLDFGDPAIVPRGHAYVVYDDEAREFVVEDGKQKIIVRLNGRLLTETMPIAHGDELRIGATTLRFVALCGRDFDWSDAADAAEAGMSSGDGPQLVAGPANS